MEESQRVSISAAPPPEALFVERLEAPDEALAIRQRALQAVFDVQSTALKNVLRSYVIKLGVAKGQEAQELTLDLYSELYLVAMKIADKFDPSRSGLPWLLRIGQNLVLRKRDEAMRVRKYEASLADLTPATRDEAAADGEIFDRLAALSSGAASQTPLEAQHAVSEILNLVAPEDRTVLQLAIVHELNGDALAAQLGINPPAARQRLHRAINRLRIAYANHINALEVRHE